MSVDRIDWETSLHDLENFIDNSSLSDVPIELVQRLFQLAVHTYFQKRDSGDTFGPFLDESAVTATEGIVAAANILDAVDIEVFEFGMFKMLAEG
jgi:hypothetical protein